jgi:crossover junction endodeoxyribonuclease RuvC
MIILGIDPGTTRIGFGVIRSEGNSLECLDYGIIDNTKVDHHHGLIDTEKSIESLIRKYSPERACVERLFFTKNQKTAIQVSEFRGVILLVLARHGIPVIEFTPLQIKQYITGYGGAQKSQMQRMVGTLLKVKKMIKPDDAADALAAAICGSGGSGNS